MPRIADRPVYDCPQKGCDSRYELMEDGKIPWHKKANEYPVCPLFGKVYADVAKKEAPAKPVTASTRGGKRRVA